MAELSPCDLRRVRRELVAEFGRDGIPALHREVPLLDRGALVVHWAASLALVGLLGTLPPPGIPWILCFLFQGFVMMAFGYVLHDLFVHRCAGGRRFARWAGLFAGAVTRLPFFRDGGDCHLVHHIFPHIPFCNVGRAADLFRPFLLRQGVRERRSLLGLLWGHLVRVEPHRALWST